MSSAEEPNSPEADPTEDGAGDREHPSDGTGTASETTEPAVTPQSQELRRQQYAVGVGTAILAGVALAISSMQHFPDLPESVPLVAGFVGAGLVHWIVTHSFFPTEEDAPASE